MLESLLPKLTDYFADYRKSCIKNILILVLCILVKETLNLNRLKGAVSSVLDENKTQPNSHYKRLIRIFDFYSFTCLWLDLMSFAFQLLHRKVNYLLLDGTSWKSGTKSYHYLTLCVVYNGVAIPIYWVNLKKMGVSNTKERKQLLKKVRRRFCLAGKTLIADREYIGTEWFKALIDNNLDFVIRLRHKAYQDIINEAEGQSYAKLRQKVMTSRIAKKALRKQIYLNGMLLYFVVFKNPKNDPKEPVIYLLTTLDLPAKKIAGIYMIRWKIEHCFKQLKSNGFQLEQINLKGESRNRLLMAIMVFAYVLSIHEGLKTYKKTYVKEYKKRSDPTQKTKERAVSVFRHGIDLLMKFCRSITSFCQYMVTQFQAIKGKPKCRFLRNVQ